MTPSCEAQGSDAARILYVDDEEDIREVAVMSLELDPGFDVRTAASGAQALAEASAWRPRLILLDVMMPQMDGVETLRRLREDAETATIPVVFVTARTRAEDVARFIALGAAGVIAKPFDPMALAGEVREHLVN